MRPRWRRTQDGKHEHSPGEIWSVVAATVAGAITLLLLVYMSHRWSPLSHSAEASIYLICGNDSNFDRVLRHAA
jgi:hypothetical protein